MKKINKINPIAKLLPKFGKRVVEDKRNKQKDKQAKKDIEDGKTFQDRWPYQNIQSVTNKITVW